MGKRVGVIPQQLVVASWMVLALGVGLASCQFPDYRLDDASAGTGVAGSGVSGVGNGGGGGGGGSAAGAGGSGDSCEPGHDCFSLVPDGWLGPLAVWRGTTSSPEDMPPCPDGYGKPTDVFAELVAPDATCTCSCSSTPQECVGPIEVVIHNDLDCKNPCATAAAAACAPVGEEASCTSSVSSILAVPKAPAGTCVPQVEKIAAPPEWRQAARLCALDSGGGGAGAGACENDDQECVPVPEMPFSSDVCVYRVALEGSSIPDCPSEYPTGPQVFHSRFSDGRACGACTCAGPTGGRCGGKIYVSTEQDCSDRAEYTIGSGCEHVSLSEPPSHVAAELVLTATGTCAVGTPPAPIGKAVPSGSALVVCCP